MKVRQANLVGQKGPLMELEERVWRAGAYNLKNPGTYVNVSSERIVIGNRPGRFHYTIAIVFPCLAIAVAWMIGRQLWWLAAIFILLFGVFPILPLFNRQRFEIERGVLKARGRALGRETHRDWPLHPQGAVRVEDWWYRDSDSPHTWPQFQLQLRTPDGWIGVAELLHDREPLLRLAHDVSVVSGVPLLDDETAVQS